MFKDLKTNLWKINKDSDQVKHVVDIDKHVVDIDKNVDKDAEIACNIVNILFNHVLASVQMDRSSVKLNALTRGMIGGVLKKTSDGTKEYILGMSTESISLLLDDLEKELMKRYKARK